MTDQLLEQIRRRFVRDGAPASQAGVVRAVREHPHAVAMGDTAVLDLARRMHADLVGAGPLGPLLADPEVCDVVVNGVEVWLDRGAGLRRGPFSFRDRAEVRRLAQRLVSSAGRRLDDASPCADVRLPDGTRLHAVLPPVAPEGPLLSLRTFRPRPFALADLVGCGTLTAPVAELLAAVIAARLAYLVTGGTGSGKTTLLACLLSLVPPEERVVLVEDAAELRPAHPHVVGLQARTSNVEGVGEVPLRDLVRNALRMRPDRIVVGECRGAEIVDLLAALNTGHDGGAGTLHANAPADVPARLEALGLLGGLPRLVLHAQVAAALQVVIHLRRTTPALAGTSAASTEVPGGGRAPISADSTEVPGGDRTPTPAVPGGGRVIDAICLLVPHPRTGLVRVAPVWRRGQGAGEAAVMLSDLLRQRGVTPPSWLDHVAGGARGASSHPETS